MSAVTDKFEKIGARARISDAHPTRGLRIDIATDSRGEFFDLRVPAGRELEVLDLQPRDRHLVLLVRGDEKKRFLCGHDERHYFVAAVPLPITTVEQAKEALKPPEARVALRRRDRNRRRTPAYVRQGEWFFVLEPRFDPAGAPVHRREPIRRGNGRPHVCEELCRTGGETAYVHDLYAPDGLTEREYERALRRTPELERRRWSPMRRNATVHVRGKVTHPDHATVDLRGWHRVLPNTEAQAAGRRLVAFLD